jgi:tetratricopeptide (TPR) repeat protein
MKKERRAVMRWRFPFSLWVAVLAACLILVSARAGWTGEALSRGVSDLVFHLTTYDELSRPLQKGQGIVVGPNGVAVVSVSILEGAAWAEATMMDGRTLFVRKVYAVDEVSGLAKVSFQRDVPSPAEKLITGRVPQVGERIIFSRLTVASKQVCVECGITLTRRMPGIEGLSYVETSQPIPRLGGSVFDSYGNLVGVVAMRFGGGFSGILASNERVMTLAVQPSQNRALDDWAKARDDRWRENAYARYMAGHAALWRGQPGVALDLLEDHIGAWPVLKAEIPALLGEAYLALDLLPEAIMALKAAIDYAPAPCWAYQKLTWAYMEAGRHDLAEAACRTVIEMEPDSQSGYLLMAHLHNLRGDHKQAVFEARRALKRKPDCACSHYERGVAYVGLIRYEDAIESLINATTLDPEYGEAYNYLGYAYLRNHNPSHAVVALEEAVRLKPEMTAAWDNLGEAYTSAGFPVKALNAFRQSVCIDSSRSHSFSRLARAFMKQGRYAEAAEVLRQGLVRWDRSPWLVYYLGKVYFLEGRKDLATQQVELLYKENKSLAEQLLRAINLDSNG